MYLWNNTFLCFVMEFSILRYSSASFLDPSNSSFSFSTALTLLSLRHSTVTIGNLILLSITIIRNSKVYTYQIFVANIKNINNALTTTTPSHVKNKCRNNFPKSFMSYTCTCVTYSSGS